MEKWMHEMRAQSMAADLAEIAHLLSLDEYMSYADKISEAIGNYQALLNGDSRKIERMISTIEDEAEYLEDSEDEEEQELFSRVQEAISDLRTFL